MSATIEDIRVRGLNGNVERVEIVDDKVNEGTLRRAFFLKDDVSIQFTLDGLNLPGIAENSNFTFLLPKERKNKIFQLRWEEARRFRPVTPQPGPRPTPDEYTIEAKDIRVRGLNGNVERVEIVDDKVNEGTLRRAFFLEDDVSIQFTLDGINLKGFTENGDFTFRLPKERKNKIFQLRWDEARRSRPVTPQPGPRPTPDEYTAPSPPQPLSKSIDRFMFFAVDVVGKSTVVCVHKRYFVTFRHGTHLQLHIGNVMRIFHAKVAMEEQSGYEVSVVDINEELDFVLLRSEQAIVDESPRLAAAEESQSFLLAGFGDQNTGTQELAYLAGIVYSTRGYYYGTDYRPNLIMGPFLLGTVRSCPGDSGGACWSVHGLIGINFGVTRMPATSHLSAIADAAIFSPKNIISPSVPYIKNVLMEQLLMDEQKSMGSLPAKKMKPYQTEIPGLGLLTNFDA